MHILYLDDSGAVKNPADNHIILAGLAVFERVPHWFSRSLDNLAKDIWPTDPEHLEFRGVDILSGRKQWRGVNRDRRTAAYQEALTILSTSARVRLFGAAIHKARVAQLNPPEDPMEYAFEQVASRFDMMLGRLHKGGDTQRGLIVLDKSAYETSLQTLSVNFRKIGHRWGQLRNLSEVPLFVDSRATRMIQFADLVAHAVRRYYEKGDATYFDIIKGKFDAEGGVLHGLTHFTPLGTQCNCFACK